MTRKNRGIVEGRPLLLLLLFAACDTGSSAARWRGSMDTLPSGTIVVKNTDLPMWDSAAGWRLVEDLRIGATDGTGPAVFGEIGGVAQDSAGRVYVLDQQAQEIRVFANDGSYVRTIGRRGGGPGEFRGAFGLLFDRANNLWTLDSSNARYQVFDDTGGLLRTYRRNVGAVLYPFLGGMDADGLLYDAVINPVQPGAMRFSFVPVDSTGVQRDSLPPIVFDRAPKVPLSSMALFSVLPRLVFRMDGHGSVWFGVSDEYRLYQRRFAGDTVRIVEKQAQTFEVSTREREVILEDLRKSNSLQQQDLIPIRKPFYVRLVPDTAGNLFVMLSGSGAGVGTQFDVFDPEGRYLGRTAISSSLEAMPAPLISGDHLLGVTQNAQGANIVVRYRIVKPVPHPPN